MSQLRLLYLGTAFPPGVSVRFPQLKVANQAFETNMICCMREFFDIRSVGFSEVEFASLEVDPNASPGLPNRLDLLDKAPELSNRLRSVLKLRRAYAQWLREGWKPDVILTYNLYPIYNSFIRWLSRKKGRPTLVLLLADSSRLDQHMPLLKALRHRFKPLMTPDAEAVEWFDACIGLSQTSARFFKPRGVPFLWMPGACRSLLPTPTDDTFRDPVDNRSRPPSFGYFGALADHSGILPLTKLFRSSSIRASLRICGYGKLAPKLIQEAAADERISFYGFFQTAKECLEFGRSCDVLVNPRPSTHGNENNFPSKIFDYALCRRAILSTRLGGVDVVLGSEATYFDAANFDRSLLDSLGTLATVPRPELFRRGYALHQRVIREYNWKTQAGNIAEFIQSCSPVQR